MKSKLITFPRFSMVSDRQLRNLVNQLLFFYCIDGFFRKKMQKKKANPINCFILIVYCAPIDKGKEDKYT